MRTDLRDPDSTWAGTAVTNVTIGSLLVIWSGLWLYYLVRNDPDHSFWTYLASGSLLTGLALLVVGMSMGLVRRNTEEEVEEGGS